MEIIRYTGTNQSKKWGMAARQKGRKLMQWDHPKTTSTGLHHETSAPSAVPTLPAPLLTALLHPRSCLVAHQGISAFGRGQSLRLITGKPSLSSSPAPSPQRGAIPHTPNPAASN